MTDIQKNWWTPVWKGLVIDKDEKHYRRMRNSIWLYLYLLLNADRKSGLLLRKIKTISLDMGLRKDTVSRWLNILRRYGYIATENTGRCLLIEIKKWKGLPQAGNMSYQKGEIPDIRCSKNPIPQGGPDRQNSFHLSQKSTDRPDPNDISIKKDILNNDIDNNFFGSTSDAFKGFKPATRREVLALDLAETLNDRKGLALYLSYAKKYPESLLRRVLGEVMEIPDHKIKKSRGALFNHLIQKYVKETHQYIRP